MDKTYWVQNGHTIKVHLLSEKETDIYIQIHYIHNNTKKLNKKQGETQITQVDKNKTGNSTRSELVH